MLSVDDAIGKRVGSAWYLHCTALADLDSAVTAVVRRAVRVVNIESKKVNVVRLDTRCDNRVSLLSYEDFDTNAFPALQESWTVDLGAGEFNCRSYMGSRNPPILHRKELLLPTDDPRREKFAQLTQELEKRGLFKDAKRIGFKKQWEQRLAEHGVEIRDHQVVEVVARTPQTIDIADVARHKTAISRGKLSAPMQALARHGLIDEQRKVLDYGCGRGDDVAVLKAAGIEATGWDPHYHPDAPLEQADVVNLGFVLNVIEDAKERVTTTRRAFELAGQCLSIAVIPAGRMDTGGLAAYRDGFLSSRGTFQKPFSQAEARALIEAATEREPLAVAPGIFFVFRDKIAEQRFLAARSRGAWDISKLLAISPPSTPAATLHEQTLVEEHRELIDALWEHALELGRLPVPEELDEAVYEGIEQVFGSVRKASRLAERVHDPQTLAAARAARVEDLRVYFALNLFNQRRRYRELADELRRDIKAFFGSQTNAEAAGRELLFSLGDAETVGSTCREAAEAGLGHLFEDHSLQLHAGLIPRLPAALRAYIGCAEKMYGDINGETVDLVKIHIHSGKLTVQRYDDFFGKPLPSLLERVKIKLRGQDIDVFDHTNDETPPVLTMKSRYMASDQSGYDKQKRFDDALAKLPGVDFNGYGPSTEELQDALTSAGVKLRGWKLARTWRSHS